MSRDYNNPAFKKLVQKLQEESWQLELLISGFAIFGLFTAYPIIEESVRDSQHKQQIYMFVIATVALISCGILIFNLLLHVLLRGLWIGALGLRYVSGDIDYEVLNYHQRFTKYLKKKVGSFDKYIGTLENYCSVIFAISFLLIFYVLAITLTIISIALIGKYIIDNDNFPNWVSQGIGIPLILFFLIGMFITFIDFVTLGFLKKKKWISKFYFPIYWVFSFITLSFLYRPLVYNFLDNKFGRRLSFVLVPFFFIILLFSSFSYNSSNYYSVDTESNDFMANNKNYEDLVDEKKSIASDVMIQSKVIRDDYLKVFMAYSESIEDRVFTFNPSLKPKKDIRGLESKIEVNGTFINRRKRDSTKREYLKTLNSIYYIVVDSTKQRADFIFSQNKKGELGFETYVKTKGNINEGKHILKVNRIRVKNKDTTRWNVVKIPFWYYND